MPRTSGSASAYSASPSGVRRNVGPRRSNRVTFNSRSSAWICKVMGGWLLLFAWLAKRKQQRTLPPAQEGTNGALYATSGKGVHHGT